MNVLQGIDMDVTPCFHKPSIKIREIVTGYKDTTQMEQATWACIEAGQWSNQPGIEQLWSWLQGGEWESGGDWGPGGYWEVEPGRHWKQVEGCRQGCMAAATQGLMAQGLFGLASIEVICAWLPDRKAQGHKRQWRNLFAEICIVGAAGYVAS